jgi:hypothetical protein
VPIARRLLLVAGLAACGGDGQGGVVPAGAFERPDDKSAMKKLDAAKKAAAEDEAKRAAALEAELAALTDKVAIVPEPKPRTLALACKAAADAMDALVQRQFAGDAKGLAEWNADKATTLADFEKRCTEEDTLDTASCKAHAMSHADDRLVGDAFGLMQRCDDKFKPAKTAPKPG